MPKKETHNSRSCKYINGSGTYRFNCGIFYQYIYVLRRKCLCGRYTNREGGDSKQNGDGVELHTKVYLYEYIINV